jgi:hypothetical protein
MAIPARIDTLLNSIQGRREGSLRYRFHACHLSWNREAGRFVLKKLQVSYRLDPMEGDFTFKLELAKVHQPYWGEVALAKARAEAENPRSFRTGSVNGFTQSASELA